MPSKTERAWERQPNESAQAYEAFSIYLEQGADRSQREVAKKLGKSLTLISRWASKYEWVERCRQYDNHLAEEARKKAVKDIQAMNKRHITAAINLMSVATTALLQMKPEDLDPKDVIRFMDRAAAIEKAARLSELEVVTSAEKKQEETNAAPTLADVIQAAYDRRKGGGG